MEYENPYELSSNKELIKDIKFDDDTIKKRNDIAKIVLPFYNEINSTGNNCIISLEDYLTTRDLNKILSEIHQFKSRQLEEEILLNKVKNFLGIPEHQQFESTVLYSNENRNRISEKGFTSNLLKAFINTKQAFLNLINSIPPNLCIKLELTDDITLNSKLDHLESIIIKALKILNDFEKFEKDPFENKLWKDNNLDKLRGCEIVNLIVKAQYNNFIHNNLPLIFVENYCINLPLKLIEDCDFANFRTGELLDFTKRVDDKIIKKNKLNENFENLIKLKEFKADIEIVTINHKSNTYNERDCFLSWCTFDDRLKFTINPHFSKITKKELMTSTSSILKDQLEEHPFNSNNNGNENSNKPNCIRINSDKDKPTIFIATDEDKFDMNLMMSSNDIESFNKFESLSNSNLDKHKNLKLLKKGCMDYLKLSKDIKEREFTRIPETDRYTLEELQNKKIEYNKVCDNYKLFLKEELSNYCKEKGKRFEDLEILEIYKELQKNKITKNILNDMRYNLIMKKEIKNCKDAMSHFIQCLIYSCLPKGLIFSYVPFLGFKLSNQNLTKRLKGEDHYDGPDFSLFRKVSRRTYDILWNLNHKSFTDSHIKECDGRYLISNEQHKDAKRTHQQNQKKCPVENTIVDYIVKGQEQIDNLFKPSKFDNNKNTGFNYLLKEFNTKFTIEDNSKEYIECFHSEVWDKLTKTQLLCSMEHEHSIAQGMLSSFSVPLGSHRYFLSINDPFKSVSLIQRNKSVVEFENSFLITSLMNSNNQYYCPKSISFNKNNTEWSTEKLLILYLVLSYHFMVKKNSLDLMTQNLKKTLINTNTIEEVSSEEREELNNNNLEVDFQDNDNRKIRSVEGLKKTLLEDMKFLTVMSNQNSEWFAQISELMRYFYGNSMSFESSLNDLFSKLDGIKCDSCLSRIYFLRMIKTTGALEFSKNCGELPWMANKDIMTFVMPQDVFKCGNFNYFINSMSLCKMYNKNKAFNEPYLALCMEGIKEEMSVYDQNPIVPEDCNYTKESILRILKNCENNQKKRLNGSPKYVLGLTSLKVDLLKKRFPEKFSNEKGFASIPGGETINILETLTEGSDFNSEVILENIEINGENVGSTNNNENNINNNNSHYNMFKTSDIKKMILNTSISELATNKAAMSGLTVSNKPQNTIASLNVNNFCNYFLNNPEERLVNMSLYYQQYAITLSYLKDKKNFEYCCYIFNKNQTGIREIYVTNAPMRIGTFFLEQISRKTSVGCKYNLQNNPKKVNIFLKNCQKNSNYIKEFYKKNICKSFGNNSAFNSNTIKMRNNEFVKPAKFKLSNKKIYKLFGRPIPVNFNTDSKRWGPNQRMDMLISTITPYFTNLDSDLFLMTGVIMSCMMAKQVKYPQKLIKYAKKISDLKIEDEKGVAGKFVRENMLELISNKPSLTLKEGMGQGLLQETSSNLHACKLFNQEIILRSKLGDNLKKMFSHCTSDDAITSLILLAKENSLIDCETKLNSTSLYKKLLNLDSKICSYFGILRNDTKSTVSLKISELNSYFCNSGILMPSNLKLLISKIKVGSGKDFFGDLVLALSSHFEYMSSGGNYTLSLQLLNCNLLNYAIQWGLTSKFLNPDLNKYSLIGLLNFVDPALIYCIGAKSFCMFHDLLQRDIKILNPSFEVSDTKTKRLNLINVLNKKSEESSSKEFKDKCFKLCLMYGDNFFNSITSIKESIQELRLEETIQEKLKDDKEQNLNFDNIKLEKENILKLKLNITDLNELNSEISIEDNLSNLDSTLDMFETKFNTKVLEGGGYSLKTKDTVPRDPSTFNNIGLVEKQKINIETSIVSTYSTFVCLNRPSRLSVKFKKMKAKESNHKDLGRMNDYELYGDKFSYPKFTANLKNRMDQAESQDSNYNFLIGMFDPKMSKFKNHFFFNSKDAFSKLFFESIIEKRLKNKGVNVNIPSLTKEDLSLLFNKIFPQNMISYNDILNLSEDEQFSQKYEDLIQNWQNGKPGYNEISENNRVNYEFSSILTEWLNSNLNTAEEYLKSISTINDRFLFKVRTHSIETSYEQLCQNTIELDDVDELLGVNLCEMLGILGMSGALNKNLNKDKFSDLCEEKILTYEKLINYLDNSERYYTILGSFSNRYEQFVGLSRKVLTSENGSINKFVKELFSTKLFEGIGIKGLDAVSMSKPKLLKLDKTTFSLKNTNRFKRLITNHLFSDENNLRMNLNPREKNLVSRDIFSMVKEYANKTVSSLLTKLMKSLYEDSNTLIRDKDKRKLLNGSLSTRGTVSFNETCYTVWDNIDFEYSKGESLLYTIEESQSTQKLYIRTSNNDRNRNYNLPIGTSNIRHNFIVSDKTSRSSHSDPLSNGQLNRSKLGSIKINSTTFTNFLNRDPNFELFHGMRLYDPTNEILHLINIVVEEFLPLNLKIMSCDQKDVSLITFANKNNNETLFSLPGPPILLDSKTFIEHFENRVEIINPIINLHEQTNFTMSLIQLGGIEEENPMDPDIEIPKIFSKDDIDEEDEKTLLKLNYLNFIENSKFKTLDLDSFVEGNFFCKALNGDSYVNNKGYIQTAYNTIDQTEDWVKVELHNMNLSALIEGAEQETTANDNNDNVRFDQLINDENPVGLDLQGNNDNDIVMDNEMRELMAKVEEYQDVSNIFIMDDIDDFVVEEIDQLDYNMGDFEVQFLNDIVNVMNSNNEKNIQNSMKKRSFNNKSYNSNIGINCKKNIIKNLFLKFVRNSRRSNNYFLDINKCFFLLKKFSDTLDKFGFFGKRSLTVLTYWFGFKNFFLDFEKRS